MVQNINNSLIKYLYFYYQNKNIGYYKFNYIINNNYLICTVKAISHTETILFCFNGFQWNFINNFII